jgi:hypothetical protein
MFLQKVLVDFVDKKIRKIQCQMRLGVFSARARATENQVALKKK